MHNAISFDRESEGSDVDGIYKEGKRSGDTNVRTAVYEGPVGGQNASEKMAIIEAKHPWLPAYLCDAIQNWTEKVHC
jgi:hypothetical protein